MRATRGRPGGTASRASLRASSRVPVGEWVRIPVPGEPFPVHMRIGTAPEQAAFLDHEADGQGGYTAVAAMRAPSLPPGVHEVIVRLPDGTAIVDAVEIL